MRSRQTPLDLFSTFLKLEADQPRGWLSDPRLHRSMERLLGDGASVERGAAKLFWGVYWHKRWLAAGENSLEVRLALGHLSAYLQEACYWATQKLMPQVESLTYRFADCFQLAIVQVPRILKAFDPDGVSGLETYATLAFGNLIREQLRTSRTIALCSDWGLLLKLSGKQLTEALLQAGMGTAMVQRSVRVWKLFCKTYPVTTGQTMGQTMGQTTGQLRKLPKPTTAYFAELARLYQAQNPDQAQDQAQDSGMLAGRGDAAPTAQMIEAWLLQCAQQARAYLYPSPTSLNTPQFEEGGGEWQDQLTTAESPMGTLLQAEAIAERQAQVQQLRQALQAVLGQLDAESQELLDRYYCQRQTQTAIAQGMALKQYQISRKLSRIRETLVKALVVWSVEQGHSQELHGQKLHGQKLHGQELHGQELHSQPNSTMVQAIGAIVDEWLQQHYGERVV